MMLGQVTVAPLEGREELPPALRALAVCTKQGSCLRHWFSVQEQAHGPFEDTD